MSWKEAIFNGIVAIVLIGIFIQMKHAENLPEGVLFMIDSHGIHRLEKGTYISGCIHGRIRHISVYDALK